MSDPTTEDQVQDTGDEYGETQYADPEQYDDGATPTTDVADATSEDYVLEAPLGDVPKPPFVWGTGRRKSSVARVRLTPGSGNVHVKRSGGAFRELNDYFQNERDRKTIFGPLEATQYGGKLDIYVNASGGGSTGQAGAIVMGLARAIAAYDPQAESALREGGYLTRDSRMKERKKYGQLGARRKFQFSKR